MFKKKRSNKGMTLVEVMVTSSVFGLTMIGLTSFVLDSQVILFKSEAKNLINKDVRSLTNSLAEEARSADDFIIYESFGGDLRTVNPDYETDDPLYIDTSDGPFSEDGDEQPTGLEPEDYAGAVNPYSVYHKRPGQSGDFLLLVTRGEDPTPADRNTTGPIKKLVGYYRSVENLVDQTGPVRKFVIYPQGTQGNLHPEELVPAINNKLTFPVVVELSKGLANRRLFYNFRDKAAMVNGQIFHGNDAKRVTDTYNFTISPRAGK